MKIGVKRFVFHYCFNIYKCAKSSLIIENNGTIVKKNNNFNRLNLMILNSVWIIITTRYYFFSHKNLKNR
jgi:hypothetical protein